MNRIISQYQNRETKKIFALLFFGPKDLFDAHMSYILVADWLINNGINFCGALELEHTNKF